MTDRRNPDATAYAHSLTQQSWASGETTASSEDVPLMKGICRQIEVKVTENTTNNITFTLAATSALGGTLFSVAAIADNGTTVLKATSDATDFDAFIVDGTVTWAITPSGDPGATGATVDVNVYLE